LLKATLVTLNGRTHESVHVLIYVKVDDLPALKVIALARTISQG